MNAQSHTHLPPAHLSVAMPFRASNATLLPPSPRPTSPPTHTHSHPLLQVDLDLLSVALVLAALCPTDEKRVQLIGAHKAYLNSPAAAKDFAKAGGWGMGWMPPEAAIAAANQAELCASWLCPR